MVEKFKVGDRVMYLQNRTTSMSLHPQWANRIGKEAEVVRVCHTTGVASIIVDGEKYKCTPFPENLVRVPLVPKWEL